MSLTKINTNHAQKGDLQYNIQQNRIKKNPKNGDFRPQNMMPFNSSPNTVSLIAQELQ